MEKKKWKMGENLKMRKCAFWILKRPRYGTVLVSGTTGRDLVHSKVGRLSTSHDNATLNTFLRVLSSFGKRYVTILGGLDVTTR
jgi:hypothetical protein